MRNVFILLAAIGLTLNSGCKDDTQACTTDDDCKFDRVCNSAGSCEAPDLVDASASDASLIDAGAPDANNAACAVDCSTLETGECEVAQCNESTGLCVVESRGNGSACDDSLFCTVGEVCMEGACLAGQPNDCGEVPGECQEVLCDELLDTCTVGELNEGDACLSGDLCQSNSTCQSGLCQGETTDCFFEPVPNSCNDSVCNSANGLCEPVAASEGELCTDADDLCLLTTTCTAGNCTGGVPRDCSVLTSGCQIGECEAGSGECTTSPAADGMACDDLSACTTGETCTSAACGGGTPITQCEAVGDGCCPGTCSGTSGDANFDLDCELQPSCLAIKTSIPGSVSGIYAIDPDGSLGANAPYDVYCDMDSDLGGWTLVSRFSNTDAANWMLDTGEWWYTRTTPVGDTTSRSDNADMFSPAFFQVTGTEIRISRTDNPNDAALLRTNAGCLPNTDFRTFITSFGNYQNGAVWGNNSVAGTCPAIMGNNYASTNGFQQATCSGDIGAPNSISFWNDWSAGDASVMMIGGGGNTCSRADHGIGVTEANSGSFIFVTSSEDDFGGNGTDAGSNDPYSLNLWVR